MVKTQIKPSVKALVLKTGSLSCSHLHLNTSSPLDIKSEIDQLLQQAPELVQQLPIIVHLPNDKRALPADAISQIIQVLITSQLKIIGVVPPENAQDYPFPWANIQTQSKPKKKTKTPTNQLKEVFGKVRSGQMIHANNQHLVVYGDVSSGAELFSTGNIYVFGTLSGKAFAGVMGDHDARIVAQKCHAELIAIAGCYQTYDELDGTTTYSESVIISLEDEQLITNKIAS